MSPSMLTSVEVFIEGERRPPKSFSSESIVFKNKGGTLCLLQQQEASEFGIIRGYFWNGAMRRQESHDDGILACGFWGLI